MNMEHIHKNCIMSNESFFEGAKLVDVNTMGSDYKRFSITEGNFQFDGPIIANYTENGKRVNYSAGPCHTLIIGGTGSGKTECFYSIQAEAIARSSNQPSVFFMDLKGDYYRKFSSLYRKMGYKIYTLNLKEPFSSSRYNPVDPAWFFYQESISAKKLIQQATGSERVFRRVTYRSFFEWKAAVQCYEKEQLELCQNYLRRLATLFVPIESQKEPSWENGSREMLYLQLLGMLEDSEYPERGMTREKYTLANAIKIAYCTEDDCDHIHKWIAERDKSSSVMGLYHFYTKNAKNTREGYISTFGTKLDKLKNISTEWITSASDIDVEKIARNVDEEKCAIFCIVDETRPESYDICMAFIDHLISALKIRNDKIGPIHRDFHILADEFANMPVMPNLQNRISTLRSYRVWLHIGIQSLDQLDDRYGDKVRKIIQDNCDVEVFFGTNNSKTVKEFADSLGERAVPITGYNINNDGQLSLSLSIADRPLVRKSDLSTMQLGEAYVKVFRRPTAVTKLEPHFRCKDLWHDNVEPEKMVANLSELEKTYYDIRTLKYNNNTRRRFDFDF